MKTSIDNKATNLIVATFMGISVYPKTVQERKTWIDIKTGKRGWKGHACDVEWFNLLYDISYDSLIPVVYKFLRIPPETFNYDTTAMSQFHNLQDSLSRIRISAPFQEIYDKVVECCDWYNKFINKKKIDELTKNLL